VSPTNRRRLDDRQRRVLRAFGRWFLGGYTPNALRDGDLVEAFKAGYAAGVAEPIERRAEAPDRAQVFVEGGWVEPTATVPLEGGIAAIVRFSRACLEANLKLNRQLVELRDPNHRRRNAAA